MRRSTFFVIGAGVYAVALAAIAPAVLIDTALARWTGGQVRLTAPHGTLWSGAGRIELRDTKGRVAAAMHTSWRFAPRALLAGKVALEVHAAESARAFLLEADTGGIAISNAELELPASALGAALPRLVPLALTGRLTVRVPHLAIRNGEVAGDAHAQWRGAGSGLAAVWPLGAYELRLAPSGRALEATLRTLEGPLELEGNGSWMNGAQRVLRASAKVPASHERELAPLLRLIGNDAGAGRYELILQ